MATVTKLGAQRPNQGGTIYHNIDGVGLANGDQSQSIDKLNARPEVAWQVTGTFGVGGSIQLEKSNNGSNWIIVGSALVAAGMAEAVTAARYLRFNVTAGDGTTSLFVSLALCEQRG